MTNFNITKGLYENPALSKFDNLSYLYSLPYEELTLGEEDKSLRLDTLISLRNKKALINKFKYKADASIRDKYYKCFTCNLTAVPSKMFKMRTSLKITVDMTIEKSVHLSFISLFRTGISPP